MGLSCNNTTVETIDKTTTLLPNGMRLGVEKTNKETTAVGIFSNHNYGTTHGFTYEVTLNPGGIYWHGGSAEPKHLIFYQDTAYISSLKKKYIKIAYTDSIDHTEKYTHETEIATFFQKHIDERYFFKLLGNDYWVDIPFDEYSNVAQAADEYAIPNDKEMTLDSDVNTLKTK